MAPYTFTQAVADVKKGGDLEAAVSKLLVELTDDERLSMLDGDIPYWAGQQSMITDRYNRIPYIMGQVERLEIPGIRFTDGPRGIVMGNSTAFPVSMARGATFDADLERRVGDAIGKEAHAQGANDFAGVCVNLPRHPAWGRVQETYGEDPVILGEFGMALTEGVQKYMMACVKHFALNSMENARFRLDVECDDDVMREVWLAHFEKIVAGGCASVMSSYNSVNGEWAGENKQLLTDILRGEWKFDGFVMSDFVFGLRDAVKSVQNGLDLEAPFAQQRDMVLRDALKSGKLDIKDVNKACINLLRKQIEFTAKCNEPVPPMTVLACDEHRALAREVSQKSMVLLKNEKVGDKPLLPLENVKGKKVAVIGRLAESTNTGDRGSSYVHCTKVVSPLEGIKAQFPDCEIIHDNGSDAKRAAQVAADADIVIMIVGYDRKDEGEYAVPSVAKDPILETLFPPTNGPEDEHILALFRGTTGEDTSNTSLDVGAGGDRASLRLHGYEEELIAAVSAANPNTVVSIIAAGAVLIENWKHKVPAIVISWYSGCEGGNALADVLLGKVDACGHLPFCIPTSEKHLPDFDAETTKIKYDRWYGQALIDKLGVKAAYPLGFGLSYTRFETSNINAKSENKDTVEVSFTVKNVGDRAGRFVAQVYGCPVPVNPDYPARQLLGFKPVDLKAGESKDVTIVASLRPLQKWDNGKWPLRSQEAVIEVAAFSGDEKAISQKITLGN
ncbi:Glycoside hydrolase, superfamily [Ascosphaera apis ARSEF 7405]|uniref:beta-glucosidase n=1 Tax=Ascosphaera apis ARSEF 7405 TaxID=392613 RepID=A0A168C820_9EURO|nr:Glycoside hydrolase, superfamily [Ascosphaera apis ARSEF 7405]